MVRKLRRRIAITLTGILTLILLGIQAFFFVSNYLYYEESQQMLLQGVADVVEESGIRTGEGVKEEQILSDDWYVPVWVFEIEDVTDVNLLLKSSTAESLTDEVRDKAREILLEEDKQGFYKGVSYLRRDGLLILSDDRDMNRYFKEQETTLLVTSVLGVLLITAISVWIAGRLTRPVDKAFEQQKQFVSDASHELKTPLAVIGANAQHLKTEIGENQWLTYILEENKRMGKLLKELLVLAKVEDGGEAYFGTVNLTKTVMGAVLSYESIAYERELDFWLDIQEDVYMQGEEEHLKQMIVILIDNAFHHVNSHGEIKVKLEKEGKEISVLVSNTGEEIPKDEQEKIFQRFYRADASRNRSENRYGLGLAIAKGIAERHKGRIKVTSQNGWTSFLIHFQKA